MKPWIVTYPGTTASAWRLFVPAVVAATAAVTAGAAIAYSPGAAAALAFILFIAISRSRESAVGLWLGLRVLMFAGYVPLSIGEGMLAIVTVVALLRRIGSGGRLQMPRSYFLWLLLLILVAVNLAYFGLVTESRDYAIEIIVENFLLVTLIANTKSRWARDGAVTAVGLVLVGIGSVATLEWFSGRPLVLNSARISYAPLAALHTFEGTVRLGSLLLNPDLLAAAMVLGLIVWTGIALEERGMRRWIAAVCAVGLLWVAFITLSRTVFLGAPIGLAVLLAFAVRRGRVSLAHAAVAAAGACGATIATLAVVPTAWLRITTDLADPLRLGAYQTALRIMSAHPLEGLGAGWNRYITFAEQYRVTDQYRPLAHPHNSFLELAAMLGVPVALLVILLILQAFAGAQRDRPAEVASAIPVAGVVAMIVMSLVGDPITIPVLSNLFWALWAVARPGAYEPNQDPLERSSRTVGQKPIIDRAPQL